MNIKLPISVIVLTYNEEKNIEACLGSVYGWAGEILIVDSYSSDKTLEIARKYTDKIYQHPFENYSAQRNWAQKNIPVSNEWVLHLDADERVTNELFEELSKFFTNPDESVSGLLVSRRTVFMDRWIKHGGHYPAYHLRIFKTQLGRCEERRYNQHFIVEGKKRVIKGDIIDIFASDLSSMVDRHNRWTTLEAEELSSAHDRDQVKANFFGNPIERKRWLKVKFYKRIPLFLRSFLYFTYRYFFKLGFLDGSEGLIFHFLQGCWAPFLIDAKIYEIRRRAANPTKDN